MSTYVATSRDYGKVLERLVDAALVNPLFVNGLVVICLSVMLTVGDAFETGHLSLAHQSLLWLTFSALLVSQLSYSHRMLLSRLSGSFLNRGIAVAAAIAVTSLLMTVELHWLKYTPLLPKEPDPFPEFFVFIAKPVVAISALVLLSQLIPIQQQIKALQQQTLAELKQSAGSYELRHIVATISVQHVQAHDHYLELSGESQQFFVRGRMKDAIAELADADGIQVHRSHWVARQNIQQVQRHGRDLKLVLADSTVVPVARSRAHLLEGLE